MPANRDELIFTAYRRAYALIEYNNNDDVDKYFELMQQIIFTDKSLTKKEKLEVSKILNKDCDYYKILSNKGKRRICENCQEDCLATLYCEYCIRNYLKSEFSNWKSGNNDIDDLIRECQVETLAPNKVVEWIPYDDLRYIRYFTKGGFSEIYIAMWLCGRYKYWDSNQRQLRRNKPFQGVILKKLENVESANRSWFDEAKSHITITNKWPDIVPCYGLTRDPLNGNYMLVMKKLDTNLRKYLQKNHNRLTWKERIKIVEDITRALGRIHEEKAIHRDLHSGNILHCKYFNSWVISDLGFCGPVNKPLESVYGNLSYIAPEVIAEKGYTFASDIYSIAMIMWEISSGQPPFANYEDNYDFAMDIVNGMRPKITSDTPPKYKELMEQCWDADPRKRPDITTVKNKIKEINIKPSTSKIHQFNNLPEPRNATEEEQEAYHSKAYSFNIPENIDDFNNSSNPDNNSTPKINSTFKGNSKTLSETVRKLHVESRGNNQINNEREIIRPQIKKQDIDDNDEIYNNPNLHSEDQDEFEIPDDGF
ncbi:kinase-like domain-containing protein [Rhizophagus clarus]|uniref:Kinase-like domain-containing protein n=1 Tax=Rhizophagus clarus TaxID=94130 RepID=A0A8H3QRE4_9GLOM|nr:kinase-like domain-containing protein [Rhizophagus clarus]